LSAGAECTITVTFSPQAAGTRTSNLSISDNAPGSPQSIPLTGTGTVANPVPTITSISPTVIAVGAPDTTVTMFGTGIGPGSYAELNGSRLTTTFVSATELTATIPAISLKTAGSEMITIITPPPGRKWCAPGRSGRSHFP
jgi:hypothetical protein